MQLCGHEQNLEQPDRSRLCTTRVVPLIIVVATVAGLILAMTLQPNPEGVGTHEQLGLPPCGVLLMTGFPCATCGMTTAFTYAVHGRLLTAFAVHPAGATLAILTAIGTIISLYALVFGVSLGPLAKGLWRPATVWLLGAIVIFSWIYKSLVMHWNI